MGDEDTERFSINVNPLVAIFGIPILAGAILFSGMFYHGRKASESQSLFTLAQMISSGEDRVWSNGEKRRFLDDNGLGHVVIGEIPKINFQPHSDGVNIFIKTGPLGTRIYGTIERNQLTDYIRSHEDEARKTYNFLESQFSENDF